MQHLGEGKLLFGVEAIALHTLLKIAQIMGLQLSERCFQALGSPADGGGCFGRVCHVHPSAELLGCLLAAHPVYQAHTGVNPAWI